MRIINRHERHAQRQADIAKIVAIVETVAGEIHPAATTRSRNLEGDSRVLRMIPVTARGVTGTVPGTEPLAAAITHEALAVRHHHRLP